jgi:hypothetical protein
MAIAVPVIVAAAIPIPLDVAAAVPITSSAAVPAARRVRSASLAAAVAAAAVARSLVAAVAAAVALALVTAGVAAAAAVALALVAAAVAALIAAPVRGAAALAAISIALPRWSLASRLLPLILALAVTQSRWHAKAGAAERRQQNRRANQLPWSALRGGLPGGRTWAREKKPKNPVATKHRPC